MDPFTIALATFGVQKLRGKSTRTALKDAFTMGAGSYGLSAFAPSFAGQIGITTGTAPFSSLGFGAGNAANITSGAGLTTGQAAAVDGITNYGAVGSQQALASKAAADTAAANLGSLYQATPGVANAPPSFLDNLTGGIKKVVGTKDVFNPKTGELIKEGSGIMGLGTAEKLGLGAAGLTLLSGDEEQPEPPFTDEDYAKAQAKAKEQISGLGEGAVYDSAGGYTSPYDYTSNQMYAFNKGGIVDALPKYNEGGINYLPSKATHDENDVHNYVRAAGYVEDGSGNGDKDEDTILAQLADGEFVSRADAILGAGIMEGADPSSMKDMRKKGAAFFYGQQAKFKRVYDLLNASRKDN